MKRFLVIIFCMAATLGVFAQKTAGFSATTTLYEEYQPARITLTDGRVINQKQANVFLKNARLLFKRGMFDMEANMAQIAAVDFADKSFVKLDTMLVTVVDTVGDKKILCATTIDIEAYRQRAANDKVLTNLTLGEQVSTTTIDLAPSDELKYPLVNDYYFLIDGKAIEVHERTISRMLDKEKRRMLKTFMMQPDFDWSDRGYLHKILLLID